jgi:hypothetical protein
VTKFSGGFELAVSSPVIPAQAGIHFSFLRKKTQNQNDCFVAVEPHP